MDAPGTGGSAATVRQRRRFDRRSNGRAGGPRTADSQKGSTLRRRNREPGGRNDEVGIGNGLGGGGGGVLLLGGYEVDVAVEGKLGFLRQFPGDARELGNLDGHRLFDPRGVLEERPLTSWNLSGSMPTGRSMPSARVSRSSRSSLIGSSHRVLSRCGQRDRAFPAPSPSRLQNVSTTPPDAVRGRWTAADGSERVTCIRRTTCDRTCHAIRMLELTFPSVRIPASQPRQFPPKQQVTARRARWLLACPATAFSGVPSIPPSDQHSTSWRREG